MKKTIILDLFFIVLSAFSGILGIILPYIILNGFHHTPYASETISPLLRSAWEGFYPTPSVLIMIAVGLGLGLMRPQRWIILGLSSILMLVIVANIEMNIYPTSHNLYPIEFALYFIFIGAPTLLGTFIGSNIKKRI
jgi:hypothetical protein